MLSIYPFYIPISFHFEALRDARLGHTLFLAGDTSSLASSTSLETKRKRKLGKYPINICKIYVTKKKFRKPGIFDLVDPDYRELTLYNCGCILKD